MNSSSGMACNLLELKITAALLPESCSGGTAATLTEVSPVDASLLPLSVRGIGLDHLSRSLPISNIL